jgi:hypothetical protein
MGMNEQETRYHLIDPVLRMKGYDDIKWLKCEIPAPVEPTSPKEKRKWKNRLPPLCADWQDAKTASRGWADPQNHASIRKGEPLEPGKFYEVTFDLQPDDQIIPAGQQIGLLIFSSDPEYTLLPKPGTKLTVDLDGTVLTLPIVGGKGAVAKGVE